jgi:hypothetical protein
MLRSLAVLVSALVAVSAQAQDASTPKVEEKPALAAPSPEGEQSPVVLTPRGPVAPPAKLDAEVDASTHEEPDKCGIEQSLYDGKDVPVGARSYKATSPNPDGQQRKTWTAPPRVENVGRFRQSYFIQVVSESDEQWVVRDAKLVGSDGKLLEVVRIRPRKPGGNVSLNIITAVRTEGTAEPDYMLDTILLSGKDGRAIVLQNISLP